MVEGPLVEGEADSFDVLGVLAVIFDGEGGHVVGCDVYIDKEVRFIISFASAHSDPGAVAIDFYTLTLHS